MYGSIDPNMVSEPQGTHPFWTKSFLLSNTEIQLSLSIFSIFLNQRKVEDWKGIISSQQKEHPSLQNHSLCKKTTTTAFWASSAAICLPDHAVGPNSRLSALPEITSILVDYFIWEYCAFFFGILSPRTGQFLPASLVDSFKKLFLC